MRKCAVGFTRGTRQLEGAPAIDLIHDERAEEVMRFSIAWMLTHVSKAWHGDADGAREESATNRFWMLSYPAKSSVRRHGLAVHAHRPRFPRLRASRWPVGLPRPFSAVQGSMWPGLNRAPGSLAAMGMAEPPL